MFHIELTCNPNSVWRFNMTEQQLYTSVLVPWAKGESIELGEHTWRPSDTKITVVEGPQIPVGRLTLGRGWPTARREGKEVTTEVIATFQRRFAAQTGYTPGAVNGSRGIEMPGQPLRGRAASEAAFAAGSGPQAGDVAATGSAAGEHSGADLVLADAFALELLRTLAEGPLPLHSAWRLARERHPQMQAGASLELAMNAVVSLIASQLAALAKPEAALTLSGPASELESQIRSMDGWLADSGPDALELRRL